jgi:serine phosphatase RsbU (regulator of sigma subunit)
MQNIWRYISYLGTTGERRQLNQRTIVLCNQLNFVMLVTSFLLFNTTLATNLYTHDKIDLGMMRVAFLFIINLLIVVSSRFGFTQLSKLSLIFIPTIVLMIFPTLIGWVEEESYTYYSYGIIAASIIPQLLLQPDKEKILYWACLAYFFLLVLFNERIMIHFATNSFPIVDRIKTFYPYYKIVQITIFIFITASIYYLRRINFRYETELDKNNSMLDLQNKELKAQKEEIETQRDEIESQRNELEKQNYRIALQHKEIKDSIVYAKRIQTAVMPTESEILQIIPDGFVYFKPKDIVSGDFYWASQRKDKTIIVAADCTGHGVPGAFMSMLGISFLNEIINEQNVPNADEILNILRQNVLNTLSQKLDSGNMQDGMDMALVIIDNKKMLAEFAGAFNPMLLFRDGELFEIPGDHMPVGSYVIDKQKFKNNVIKLCKNDAIYLFSDGFESQFGGPDDRKFNSKAFRQLLMNVHTKPMSEQKQILETTMSEYMGNHEQMDDMMVIGIRM